MSGAHQSGTYSGTTLIQNRLDIVQIENRRFATAAQLLYILTAPGVFHDAEIVAAAGDRLLDARAETTDAVDKGRNPLNCAPGIAKITRHQPPAVMRERDAVLSSHQTRG